MKSNTFPPLIVTTFFFFLIWLLLSASFNRFHLVSGLIAALAVAWFNADRSAPGFAIPGLRFFKYFVWLLGRILQSGLHLSALILHPDLPIDPKLIDYRTNLREGNGIVLMGNSITLTPGTITVEVNSRTLVVHTMDDDSSRDITSQSLEQHIAALFREKGTE